MTKCAALTSVLAIREFLQRKRQGKGNARQHIEEHNRNVKQAERKKKNYEH
jgi:hypothetical protein